MRVVMPAVALDNDPHRIMAAYGRLMGFSRARAVWQFGFKPDSHMAHTFGVHTMTPMWVLTFHYGRVIETYHATWDAQPPSRFVNIMEALL